MLYQLSYSRLLASSRREEMVGDGGFEPPYAKQTGLQPVPFGHSGNPPNNSWVGI